MLDLQVNAQTPLRVFPSTSASKIAHIEIDVRGIATGGGEISGEVDLQTSNDLGQWKTVRTLPGDLLPYYGSGFDVETDGSSHFFRLNFARAATLLSSENGAEFHGYNGAFREALMERSMEQPAQLLEAYPAREYQASPAFDLAATEYYALLNEKLPLNPMEQELLAKNGFVVSEALGSVSPADTYYHLWRNDLPVYISADSFLHAWQFSCRKALQDVEETMLLSKLRSLIQGLRRELKTRDGQRFVDLDTYLSVALSLLNSSPTQPPYTWQLGNALRSGFYSFRGVYGLGIRVTIGDHDYVFLPDLSVKANADSLDALVNLSRSGSRVVYHFEDSTNLYLIVSNSVTNEDTTLSFQMPGDWLFLPPGETIGQPIGKVTATSVFAENHDEVSAILNEVSQESKARLPLFGHAEDFDFSQFRPRGHYVESDDLKRYFQAMMWLGRVDFRLTPGNSSTLSLDQANMRSRRHLAAAVGLTELVDSAGLQDAWSEVEQVIAGFFGRPDFMSLGEFIDFIDASGIDLSDDLDNSEVTFLQNQLLAGRAGEQEISTHGYSPPTDGESLVLPHSMAMFGQRFTLDSWTLDSVVYSRIVQDDNGVPEESDRIMRRVPTALDVAFTTFGNDAVTPELVQRMQRTPATGGMPFRDGLPYQQNLAAVRSVIDQQPESIWNESLYNQWLATLRTLSGSPPEGAADCTLTEAWAMKDLNTQLASWAQLRALAVLYVKQSATDGAELCTFPDATIEPRPLFWEHLRKMAERTATLFSDLGANRSGKHFVLFAETVSNIERLLEKQLSEVQFNDLDKVYIDQLIGDPSGSCSGPIVYAGWFARLYYGLGEGPGHLEARVADIHTDPACPDCRVSGTASGDPGGVLHVGTGGSNLLIMIERRNGQASIYAGPVTGFYEFLEPNGKRLTTNEWQTRLTSVPLAPPEWTKAYLVPSGLPVRPTPF